MAQDNSVTLVGNVTRDPEVRYADSGMAVAKFGLAVTERRFNKRSNDYDETTSFFDVVSFNTLAENASDSVAKGTRVVVVGRIQVRDWEGQDGKKGRAVEVVADEIAPSLKWATAAVTRTPKGEGRSERPAKPSGNVEAGSYNAEDEPF